MARSPASAAAPVPPPLQVPAQQPAPPLPANAPAQRRVTLFEAITAAAAGFGELSKDSKNDYLKSSYLGLPGLLKAIKPALLEQGVVIYSQCLCDNGLWLIRTTLAFVDGGEEVSSDFPVPDATNLQKIGAAFTYGVRYNLFALLAVSPDADDDGNYGGAASAPAAAALPGLPSNASWPAAGQPVATPPAMYPPGYGQATPPAMYPPGYGQAAPMAMPQYAVQPLPVLQ